MSDPNNTSFGRTGMGAAGGGKAGHTILLVEDDEELRDIVEALLEDEGYDVVPASNGKQAMDFLATAGVLPAVVLLDLMMPLVSGWECLRAIRNDPVLSSLPVVVTTATTRDRPPGVDAILTKPLRVEDLLETVARYAAGAAHESAIRP